jgi:methionine salvage enolase-phosphatase E1
MADLSSDSLKAIKFLIRQTHPGELPEVLPHISAIIEEHDSLKTNPEVLDTLKKWYEAHRQHISLPDGRLGMVSENGYAGQSIDDFTYYDSTAKVSFKFDPFTLVSEIVSDQPIEVPTCELR